MTSETLNQAHIRTLLPIVDIQRMYLHFELHGFEIRDIKSDMW